MALRVSTNASTKDRQNVVCYFCEEKGHFKPKCPKFKKYLKDKKKKGSTNKQQANLVEISEKSAFLFSTSKFHQLIRVRHRMLRPTKVCLQNLTKIGRRFS